MYVITMCVYIYMCVCTRQGPGPIVPRTLGSWCRIGQGPKPVGLWALALWHNVWPCPYWLMALTRTHLETQSKPKNPSETIPSWTSEVSPSQSTITWLGVLLLGEIRSRQPHIALGNITIEQLFGGRNQFQCHYHCSQQNIHLGLMELDPHSYEWDQEVIITPPPISSYK